MVEDNPNVGPPLSQPLTPYAKAEIERCEKMRESLVSMRDGAVEMIQQMDEEIGALKTNTTTG